MNVDYYIRYLNKSSSIGSIQLQQTWKHKAKLDGSRNVCKNLYKNREFNILKSTKVCLSVIYIFLTALQIILIS